MRGPQTYGTALVEHGVTYFRLHPCVGEWQPFDYERHRQETHERSQDTVWCRTRREFERLLKSWGSTPGWTYREIR